MKRQAPKPVSNLDLKLLDVKFIAIDDNQLYLTEALHSVRKAKLSELPSLLISKNPLQDHYPSSLHQDNSFLSLNYKNRSTLDSIHQFDQSVLSNKFSSSEFFTHQDPSNSNHSPPEVKSFFTKTGQDHQCQNELQQIKDSIQARNLIKRQDAKTKNQQNSSFSIDNTRTISIQDAELQKYRKKIQLIKKQNLLIHKQISSLYRNNINQNKEPLKKIRKIEPFKQEKLQTSFRAENLFRNRQNNADTLAISRMWEAQRLLRKQTVANDIVQPQSEISKKLASCPVIRQKINFYQNLTEMSPYKQELNKIHKKIITNNLHKNFEQYLIGTSKRVPEFIKKLRN